MNAAAYTACGLILASAACIWYAKNGPGAGCIRRAASAWNRGKAIHDRIDLSSAEKHAWRQIRRRFAREARQAALDADNTGRRPA